MADGGASRRKCKCGLMLGKEKGIKRTDGPGDQTDTFCAPVFVHTMYKVLTAASLLRCFLMKFFADFQACERHIGHVPRSGDGNVHAFAVWLDLFAGKLCTNEATWRKKEAWN